MQIATTHKNADFDALASTIAATIIYPGTIAVLPKSLNPNVKAFLSIHKDFFKVYTPNDINLEEVKSMIVVDVNSWERLDGLKVLKDKPGLDVILWDHHSNHGNIKTSWECQEEMGANISLMIRELKKKPFLSPMQTTLFLAGIYEDTGNLTFPSTRPEDAYAAGFLLEQGADVSVLSSFLQPIYGEKQKEILFEMLKSAEREEIKGYTVSISIQDITGHVESLSLVVKMYREILNVDGAFGIFVDHERSRTIIIGRSNIDGLNVGEIMRIMGGGGHPGAGSALLKQVNAKGISGWLREIISGEQRASIQISDLMSFPVETVSSTITMAEAEHILREKGFTGLPVVDQGELVGVISIRDFKKVKKLSQMNAPVKAFMNPQVLTIEPGTSPMVAAKLMVKHDVGRLPVVKDGEIIGIITRSDAMLYYYDMLPS